MSARQTQRFTLFGVMVFHLISIDLTHAWTNESSDTIISHPRSNPDCLKTEPHNISYRIIVAQQSNI